MQHEDAISQSVDPIECQYSVTQSLFNLGSSIQKNDEKSIILNNLNALHNALSRFVLTDHIQNLSKWFNLNDLELKLISLAYVSQLEPDVVAFFLPLSWYEQGPTLSLERMLILCQISGSSKEKNLSSLSSKSNLMRWQIFKNDNHSISLIQSYYLADDVFNYLLPKPLLPISSPGEVYGNRAKPGFLLNVRCADNKTVSHCYSMLLKKPKKTINMIEGLNRSERFSVICEITRKNSRHLYSVLDTEDEMIPPGQLLTAFRYMFVTESGGSCYLYWPNMMKYCWRQNTYNQVISLLIGQKNLILFFDNMNEYLNEKDATIKTNAVDFNRVIFDNCMPSRNQWNIYTLRFPKHNQFVSAWLSISEELQRQYPDKVTALNKEDAQTLATLYPIYPRTMMEIVDQITVHFSGEGGCPSTSNRRFDIFTQLQNACLRCNSQSTEGLALLSEPRYQLHDMTLANNTQEQLEELINRIRFSKQLQRTIPNFMPGAQALLWGKPGTGKSMAGEAIAGQLKLPLYKVNLSNVASKWIGETEKHLAKLFDRAEEQNAVLLFDEADAIFSKRSEIESSHDKNANMGVSFLLQRMETYTGILLLSTNFKSNLDDAFLRRFHSVIEFPMPNVFARKTLWEKIWAGNIKPDVTIDIHVLGELFEFSPSQISNIAQRAILYAFTLNQNTISKLQLTKAIRRELEKQNAGYLAEKKLSDWLGVTS